MLLRELRGVDVRHLLVGDRGEESLEHREFEDPGVVAGNLAFGADLEFARHTADERHEKTPESLGEWQVGPDRLARLGRVHVDGERHELAGECQLDHRRDRVAGLVLGLASAGTEVRRDDHRVDLEQRRLGHRLGREHVERGAGDHAIAQALGEVGLVDDAATSDVHHSQARLRLHQQITVDQPDRLGRLRQVHGEEVRLGNDLIERHQLDAHLLRPVLRHERVVGHQAHAETLGTIGDQLADPAEADDPERLVAELDALPAAALPTPLHQRGVGLGHVARRRHQQRHRVFGRGDDVALRRVDHHHTTLGSGIDVDVVEADARAPDHHEIGTGSEHSIGHLGGRPDDQCVCPRNHRQQFVGGQAELHVDVVAEGTEPVEAPFGDLFGDQDASHGPHTYLVRGGSSTRFDEPFSPAGYVRGHDHRSRAARRRRDPDPVDP